MTSGRSAWGCGAAVLALSIALAAFRPDQVTAVSVVGIVVNSEPAPEPLRLATVQLTGITTPVRRFAGTDDDGWFRFDNVEPGRYSVTATRPGYLAGEHGASVADLGGTAIEVGPDTARAPLTIALVKGAVVSGMVQDTDGTPVAFGSVVAVDGDGRSFRGLTDFRGEYRIYGLWPGKYVIRLDPGPEWRSFVQAARVMTEAQIDRELSELQRGSGGPTAAGARRPAPLQTEGVGIAPVALTGYASVFYPGTVDRSAATAIDLVAGEERVGLDITLVKSGTGTISGRVTAPDGGPVPGVLLTTGSAAASRTGERRASTDLSGRFQLTNVPPGEHHVEAQVFIKGESGQSLWWAIGVVPVTAAAAAVLDLTLRPPAVVSGSVVIDDGQSAVPEGVGIGLERLDASSVPGAPPAASGPVRKGRFEIAGVPPGLYRLTTSLTRDSNSGVWIRSATFEGQDLMDSLLRVDEAWTDRHGVELRLSSRRTRLTGMLRRTDDSPAAGYYVLAFSQQPELWRPYSRHVQWARASQAGVFEFWSLPPGAYYLAVARSLRGRTPVK